jgi:hypothetical protein
MEALQSSSPRSDSGFRSRVGGASRGQRFAARAWLGVLALSAAACEPQLRVGEWVCSTDAATPIPAKTDPVAVPWSSSFEDRFCDYTQLAGFCYSDPSASYEIVTTPVHSGKYAAAFHVNSADPEAIQARCVRQGALPVAAYYGAWYFIPALARNSKVWNLIHFQGGELSGLHGLWDVSLANTSSGDLQLIVFDFLNGVVRRPPNSVPVPIGAWFHIQLYLKRAADPTGEVALYLDGRELFKTDNLITDDSDYGQWYVGNFADGLMPSDSTLYVDDVSIGATL